MTRTTRLAGAAVLGVASLALATPAFASFPHDDEAGGGPRNVPTRCVGDEPLYDHPMDYLPPCPAAAPVAGLDVGPTDPVRTSSAPNPALVAGAVGGFALVGVGTVVLRRVRPRASVRGEGSR